MLNEILSFIFDSIKGIFIAVLLLVVGLVFAPDTWTIRVINFLKPKLLNKIKLLFRSVVNLFVNNSIIMSVHNDNVGSQMLKIQELNNELEKLEKSSFFIDSVIGIFEMLSYILYADPNNTSLYESTAEYFDCYCSMLMELEDKELQQKLGKEFYFFSSKIDKISDKYDKMPTDKPKRIQEKSREQREVISEFSAFLKQLKKDNTNKIQQKKEDIINASDIIVEEVEL